MLNVITIEGRLVRTRSCAEPETERRNKIGEHYVLPDIFSLKGAWNMNAR